MSIDAVWTCDGNANAHHLEAPIDTPETANFSSQMIAETCLAHEDAVNPATADLWTAYRATGLALKVAIEVAPVDDRRPLTEEEQHTGSTAAAAAVNVNLPMGSDCADKYTVVAGSPIERQVSSICSTPTSSDGRTLAKKSALVGKPNQRAESGGNDGGTAGEHSRIATDDGESSDQGVVCGCDGDFSNGSDGSVGAREGRGYGQKLAGIFGVRRPSRKEGSEVLPETGDGGAAANGQMENLHVFSTGCWVVVRLDLLKWLMLPFSREHGDPEATRYSVQQGVVAPSGVDSDAGQEGATATEDHRGEERVVDHQPVLMSLLKSVETSIAVHEFAAASWKNADQRDGFVWDIGRCGDAF